VKILRNRPKESSSSEGLGDASDRSMINEYTETIVKHVRSICLWTLQTMPRLQFWNIQNRRLGLLPCDAQLQSQDLDGGSKRRCQQNTSEQGLGGAKLDRMIQLLRQEARLRSQRWYPALVIWYVMQHLAEDFDDDVIMSVLRSKMEDFATINNQENTMDARNTPEEPLGCMIRW